jgi:hypothetical protein
LKNPYLDVWPELHRNSPHRRFLVTTRSLISTRHLSAALLVLSGCHCTPSDGRDRVPDDTGEATDCTAVEDSEPVRDTGAVDDTGGAEDTAEPHPDLRLVRRGDLVLWGRPTVVAGEEGYDLQILHMFTEYAAEFGGVLLPFWGEVDTWNGKVVPMGEDYFWERMSFVEEDGLLEEIEGLEASVLRPTEAWRAELDIEAMVTWGNEPIERYNLPVIPLAIRWWQDGDNPCAWLWLHEGYERWAALFGIDMLAMTDLVNMQYSPSLGTADATDIDSDAFWDRDQSEGSHAAWAILQGWYKGSYQDLHEEFVDNPELVAAVDSISVGQLAWWLDQAGLVDVVERRPTASLQLLNDKKGWCSNMWAFLPAQPDVLVSTDGLYGAAHLVLHCDDGTEPSTVVVADITQPTSLQVACNYPAAGRYHPWVEVRQDGEVVATAQSVVAVIPQTLELERGDIALYGYPSIEEGEGRYPEELFEGFFGRIANVAGIYDPYFGYPLGTLDGTTHPMGQRYQWGHIEMATEAGDYQLWEDTVVLRPTPAMHELTDVQAMADKEEEPYLGYTRPYMGSMIQWVHWGQSEIDWMAEQPDLFERWQAVYGLDFNEIPVPQTMVYGPAWDQIEHTDITSDLFWERDRNCSTRAVWEFVWGSYVLQGEGVREQMLDNWEAAVAIDNVTPGELAWWLLHEGLVEIVYVASDPDLEHLDLPG